MTEKIIYKEGSPSPTFQIITQLTISLTVSSVVNPPIQLVYSQPHTSLVQWPNTFRRSKTYHQYQQDNYSPDDDYEDSNQVGIGEEIYNQQGEDEDENRLGEEGRIWFNGSLTEEEVKLLEEFVDQSSEGSSKTNMSNPDDKTMDQTLRFQENKAKLTRLENSMAEIKELMQSFISQPKAPHNIPIPETPRNRELEFDLRHPHLSPEEHQG
ncbi:hypothetical protein MJO28_000831 [Puccinia striiformis f. sp. tritici]|uniref:Uncharacterized protein n=1 Tax=Puccinia striiformis f. sp. tritici TaxID=168172 RepID=A0ACC0EZ22_9BASI|nr:hypothetical protein MJO28_000831 [Puccinia striiformis f. sp. tritici]